MRFVNEQSIDLKFDNSDRALELKEDIYDVDDIREACEEMLINGAPHRSVARVICIKFGLDIEESDVSIYSEYFLDTKTFTRVEVANMLGDRWPNRKYKTPNELRHVEVAYEYGEIAEFDLSLMLKDMLVGNYLRSKDLAKYPGAFDDMLLKYNKSTLEIMSKIKESTGGNDFIPDAFVYAVEYPESTSVPVTGIDGDVYDPDDDPNDVGKPE